MAIYLDKNKIRQGLKTQKVFYLKSKLSTVFFGLGDALSPQIWEKYGGVSYSLTVAYIYIGEILCYICY